MVKEARRRIQQESLVPASGSTQSGIGLDVTDGRTRLSLHLGLTMLDLIPGVLGTETSSAVLPTGAIHPRRLRAAPKAGSRPAPLLMSWVAMPAIRHGEEMPRQGLMPQ